ncbi:E3 ubiquitin ligase complex SCF subunit scon-3 [Taenia solium]|eukprot:TsM_000323000 transcript=TsM_000323000 gene=TsM_000323000
MNRGHLGYCHVSVAIQSGEGDVIIPELVAGTRSQRNSKTLNEALRQHDKDVGPEVAEDDEPIAVQYVSADILRKVLLWCTYHKDDAPQQGNDENRGRKLMTYPARLKDFFSLLDACCKSVVNMIKVKTPKDTSRTFSVKPDFSPQEEEQVLSGNEWCEEK